MLPVVVAALVVVPLVEIFVLLQVGQLLGALPTVVLLVVMSVLGGVLLKREGARAWRALQAAMRAGRIPANEVADGALVVFGGALLLTPGFFTDALGLLCVLPGTRTVVRRLLLRLAARRLGVGGAGLAADVLLGGRRPQARPGGGRSVVDGEVVDGPDGPRP